MRTKKKIQDTLNTTQLPSIHISAIEKNTICIDSKFGGNFYLPKGENIPTCPEGEPLQFLAQINFAKIPYIEGFPTKGLIQFFLDTDETRFFDKIDEPDCLHELYSVRYYPSPNIDLQQEIEHTKKIDGHFNIPWFNGKMSFRSAKEVATVYVGIDGIISDLGYEEVCKQQVTPELVIQKSGYDLENNESAADALCWDFGNWGTKIGGHPAIHNVDSRTDLDGGLNYTTLLFQYDFVTKKELESDTFQFFIKPKDLINAKFDDVLFCWHNCF